MELHKRDILNAILRRDLMSFIARSFDTVDGSQTFMPNWHIELMADLLMRAFSREFKRLIIVLPPRNLKSICASVAFPAWALGHDPRLRFICASYGQDLAGKLARDCRTVMNSPWYREVFPGTRIKPEKSAEHEFETTAGGYRLSTSVGGPLTGRGGNFIIIDDYLKPQDAASAVKRQAANEWYDSTAYSRLDNRNDDVIIIVMQRLHVDDLVAHVRAKEDWELYELPAIAERQEKFRLANGRRVGRSPGEALHPERASIAALREIEANIGTRFFAAQYQQRPVPAEGNLIRQRWIRYFDELPPHTSNREIFQSWDVATTIGMQSDWSVCTTWLVQDKRFYLMDVVRKKLEFPDLKQQIKQQYEKFRPSTVLIEDVGIGTGLIQQLRREGGARVIGVRPEGSKEDRMVAQSVMFESGSVLLPRKAIWLDSYVNELLAFPAVKHDDQVDSTSQMLNWYQTRKIARIIVR